MDDKEKKITNLMYENIEQTIFFDGKVELGRHAAKLLVGNGWQLTSDDEKVEKFINQTFDNNNINTILFSLVYIMSIYGRAIMTVNKTGNKYRLEIAKPQFFSAVAKAHITPKLAIVYKQTIIGSGTFLIREEWDSEKVVRSISNKEGQEVQLAGLNAKLDKDEQIPNVEYHNLGFVPIIEFINQPLKQVAMEGFIGPFANYEELSDDHAVKTLPQLINHLYRQIFIESTISGTKIIGDFNPQEVKKLSDKDNRFNFITSNVLFNVKQIGGNAQTPLFDKIEPTRGYITELTDTIKKLKAQYYDGAGYSTQDDTVLDTATQTLYAKSKDVETTKLKRDYLIEKLNKLIDIILLQENQVEIETEKDRNFSFSINENLNVSEVETTALVVQQLQAGLITRSEGIAKLRGINEKDADDIVNKINKERDLEAERMNELIGDGGEGNGTDTEQDQPTTNEVKTST